MLDAPETLEATVYHDGHPRAQCLTLLHTVWKEKGNSLAFLFRAKIH